MASINGLMGRGSSSIYGNKNIISGLASGMDTESMIENAVSGYKLKLSMLQQQRTKIEWQQTAYRSIIDKMVAFSRKYTSYDSGTNLLSSNFFNSAVKVISQGANADKVSASGHTSSDIQINSVQQLATSAKYSVDAGNMSPSNVGDSSFDIKEKTDKGTLKGTLTLKYGGQKVDIAFDDTMIFKDRDGKSAADLMAEEINKQLGDKEITLDGGKTVKASDRIEVKVENGVIKFTEKGTASNGVSIDSASGNLKEKLGLELKDDKKTEEFTFPTDKPLFETTTMVERLHDKGFTITLDGTTKTIYGPDAKELGDSWDASTYIEKLQSKIDEAFGKGKLTVSNVSDKKSDGKSIQLKFEATNKSSKFSVTSSVGKEIGMEFGITSFANTSKNLGSLLPKGDWDSWRIQVNESDVTPDAKDAAIGVDKDGNKVKKGTDDKWYRVDDNGNELCDFQINGKSVGTFSKDSTLGDVMRAINSSENSDVTVAYSEFTGKFTFTAKQSGADGKIDIAAGGLAAAMFGECNSSTATTDTGYTKGQNAKFTVTVNGEASTEVVEKSSNSFSIDGLNITLKGTFDDKSEPVTFKKESDPDKVINVVKELVADYNAMAEEIKKAYSTIPLKQTNGKPYEPLTDKDLEGMSESAIKAYEEKAKTGLLFADRDLNNLYDGLQQALGVLGVSGNDVNKIGLTTSFKDGITTISLDETKLRAALEQDPDKVKDIFTRSTANGASSDGLMQSLKTQLDKYAGTMGAVKGVLIEKAGSTSAPTSVFNNALQKKLDALEKETSRWQKKLSSQVDYYNKKFTHLEMLVAEMNNQSSALMGLMGGGGF